MIDASLSSRPTFIGTSELKSKVNQPEAVGNSSIRAGGDSPIVAKPVPFSPSWTYFVAGASGGMAAATVTAPLDVLRTRLQSDYYQSQLAAARHARGIPPPSSMSFTRGSLLHVQETFQILLAIPRLEGWRALFKGLGPNLAGVVPARAVYFYTYTNSKKLMSSLRGLAEESTSVHIPAAICAGLATGSATNPIWVIKTRLQLDKTVAESSGGRRYKGVLDCTLKTLRHEGIRGLYRGLSASYLGVTESTMQMVLYEQGKRFLRTREARIQASGREHSGLDRAIVLFGNTVFAGASKLTATMATYPHEVIRTRLRQAPMDGGHLKYTGLLQCFRLVIKEEGLAALYGGLVPHVLRVVPSAAIMFGTFEFVVRLLGGSSEV